VLRLALGPTQLPTQWVPGTLSIVVKSLGLEADHLPPSNAKVKNSWSYGSMPHIFMVWNLVQHRDITFTFTSEFMINESV